MLYKFESCFISISYLIWSFKKNIMRKDKLSALYLGWLGHRNLGDEALYFIIKKILEKRFIIFSATKFDRIPSWMFKKKIDYLILGGGTLINRNIAVIEGVKKYSQFTKKMMILGTGVADNRFWETIEERQNMDEEWKSIFNGCDYIGVRGPHSLSYIKNIGITDAKVIGDPVLYFCDNRIKKKRKEKRIGLNFGWTDNQLWGKDDNISINLFCDYIDYLLTDEWKVSIINVYAKDSINIQKIISKNGWKKKVEYYDFSRKSNINVLKYFRSIDIFIGQKLHSCVFSSCTYTPFISLEYQPKCRDFCESIDYESYNFRIDRIAIEDLIEKTKEIYHNIDSLQRYLYEKVTYFKRLQANIYKDIFGYP